jgi:hypothetical protein
MPNQAVAASITSTDLRCSCGEHERPAAAHVEIDALLALLARFVATRLGDPQQRIVEPEAERVAFRQGVSCRSRRVDAVPDVIFSPA